MRPYALLVLLSLLPASLHAQTIEDEAVAWLQ